MNILVTGASGFLGRFLCKALQERGDSVTALNSKNCDLTRAESLHQFNSQKFDQIYHLAAWTQAGDFCLRHPGEQWMINQKINTHMLEWWWQHQPQAKLIAMGTSCSYDPSFPLSEEFYLQGTPIESLFTYAHTKRMLLVGLMALHKQYGLNYLYVVPSTLYGPNYHTDGRQLHFIFDLIRKILGGVRNDDSVTLWGNGEQKRELVHVGDFITALLYLAENEANTLFNIGAGSEHSIREFAKMICTHLNYPSDKIEYDLTKYVGAKSKVLDISKLKQAFPAYSPRPVEIGLQETIAWFHDQKI
jgi:GDP-L-fucose synthase